MSPNDRFLLFRFVLPVIAVIAAFASFVVGQIPDWITFALFFFASFSQFFIAPTVGRCRVCKQMSMVIFLPPDRCKICGSSREK
jgi:membrane protein YdbS with pleckstrin-like domain